MVDDANRDVNLGVDDALLDEPLAHAPCGKLVVLGAGEQAGDGAESVHEAGEIGELVDFLGLGKRERRGVMALAQLDECGGENCAFEMQVKLGLGQAADEGFHIVHSNSVRAGACWRLHFSTASISRSPRP